MWESGVHFSSESGVDGTDQFIAEIEVAINRLVLLNPLA